MLTKEQKADYVRGGGKRCPYCASDDIEAAGQCEAIDTWASLIVECNTCEKCWVEIFTLSDIEEG